MPASYLLYRHDNGRWYRAKILQQIRSGPERRWRVLVTYSTAPGFNYGCGEWADSDRLRPERQQDQQDHAADDAHTDAEREYQAAQQRSSIGWHRTGG